MSEDLMKDVMSRYTQLKETRQKFHPSWREAQEFADSSVISFDDIGEVPKVPNRYSSKPSNYLSTLVSGLVGYSVSPNIVWFKLSLQDEELLDRYKVKDWLEDAERVMLSEFNRSNLYSQAPLQVRDAAVIGTGVLLIDEDLASGRLRFTKLPANEVYLDINEYGEVDTVFRDYYMTLRNAVSFFGLENLDDKWQMAYEDVERWNDRLEIIQAVFPRDGRDTRFKDAKNKPWAAVYIDCGCKKIIRESGYDENPFAVFQWDPYPGYAYGTSPAQNALVDIKGLNIAKKTSWQIAQTSAEPPMKVSEDIRKIDITPRGKTYVSDASQIVEPIQTGQNYPITLQVLEDMKTDIKDWFFVDFFLMLQQKTAQMTATEVMELQGEKAATLSNLIVNLNGSLQKIIERSFNLLYRQGKIPPVPDSIRGMGAQMKVDFVGPLSQAQRKYHTMGGTMQALQAAGPIMQMFPNAGDYIDGDQLMKTAMEGQGLPQNIIREESDVRTIREQRAQAQAQAQAQAAQMQQQQNVLQNMDKLGRAAEQGSVMDMLNKQLAGRTE